MEILKREQATLKALRAERKSLLKRCACLRLAHIGCGGASVLQTLGLL